MGGAGSDAGHSQCTRHGVARALATLVVGVLVAGALTLTAAAAGAADSLANLKITADNVQIKQKGKSTFVDAKDGQALKQGDTVKTDADGRAEIDYTDGSITRLAGRPIFTISKLTNERGGRQTQGTLSVGETWNRAAKVSETGSFEVKAGGTTAAVEGTAFVAKCVPNDRRIAGGRLHVHCGRRRHQGRQRPLGRHLGDGRPVARRAIVRRVPTPGLAPVPAGSSGSPAIAAVLMVLAVILAACSSSDSKSDSGRSRRTTTEQSSGGPTAQNAATTPEGARRRGRTSTSRVRATSTSGDCADAELPQDKGEVVLDAGVDRHCGRHRDLRRRPGRREALEEGHGQAPRRRAAHARATRWVSPTATVGQPQELTREQLQADVVHHRQPRRSTRPPASATARQICRPARRAAEPGAPAATEARAGPRLPGGHAGRRRFGGVPAAARWHRRRRPDRRGRRRGGVQGLGLPRRTSRSRCCSTGSRSARSASDATGSFAGSIERPQGHGAGHPPDRVRGAGCSFNANVVVAGNLAFTGSSSNTGTYVLVGVAAVVVGCVLVVGSRRRRHGVSAAVRGSLGP